MVSFRPEGLKNTKGGGAIRPLFSSSTQTFVISQITRNHEKRRSFFTTEYTEHTEETPFRVFRVFRGEFFSLRMWKRTKTRTPPAGLWYRCTYGVWKAEKKLPFPAGQPNCSGRSKAAIQ
jgi:hypothetical protein